MGDALDRLWRLAVRSSQVPVHEEVRRGSYLQRLRLVTSGGADIQRETAVLRQE
jgi:hypothetical protein